MALQAPTDRQYWTAVRLLLAGIVVVMLVLAGALHRTDAPLQALYDDVAAGRTEAVQIVGGLASGEGYASQRLSWRTGLRWWTAEVVAVRGDVGQQSLPTGERTTDDVASELRSLAPDLTLQVQPYETGSTTVLGLRGPSWLGVPLLVLGLLGLGLLVGGPQPWRATRWAWFWLLSAPLGVLAFLLLSGPTPGLPAPRDPARRLSGLAGFVLSLFGGVVTLGLTQLSSALWPPHAR